MHDELSTQFVLTYGDIRRFDDRLKNIERNVHRLLHKDDAELVALRAEVATLLAAAQLSAEEKAAIQARIDAAVTRSQQLEDKERAALPPSTP